MDPITIGLLVGGGLGALKGIQNQKKMEENDKFRKAAIAYSPWTGMGDPGSPNMPGMLESGISGAAMGAATGNLFGAASGAAPAASTAAVGAGTPGALGAASGANPGIYGSNLQYANTLGGVDAARNLGAMNKGLTFAPYTLLAQNPNYP